MEAPSIGNITPPDIRVWFKGWEKIVNRIPPFLRRGWVKQVIGLVIESQGPIVSIGDFCIVQSHRNGFIPAEVVGFKEGRVLLMPIGGMEGIGQGCEVIATGEPLSIPVGWGLIGRVVNGLGSPIDDKGPLSSVNYKPLITSAPHPLKRRPIREPLTTGIRAIDGLLTCGKGQRLGIFSGSGIGKSVLLGMIARYTSADINVIALIGERGREVGEFVNQILGKEGLSRSVVVAVTSDQPALMRIKGGLTATTIAEFFRDQGRDVMLMMDSITRLAMAHREIGLAVGEPPTSRGYTPSLFAFLPQLLERAGASDKGSITALYTVLVEGDDLNEPVSDTVRSILDGHIVLSRKMFTQGQLPAIDPLASVSRVMPEVVTPEHLEAASTFKQLLAAYREAEDLISIGAYQQGSRPEVDHALALMPEMKEFLRQPQNQFSSWESTRDWLLKMASTPIETESGEKI